MNNNTQLRGQFLSRDVLSKTKAKLKVSDIKIDYDTKVGGFTYLANTSLKTVLNKITDTISDETTRIKNVTDVSYTLQLSDGLCLIEMENALANTLTIPADSTVNFKVGTVIDITQKGAGTTTIAPAAGVTINSIDSLTDISDQHGLVAIIKTAANEWLLIGTLA